MKHHQFTQTFTNTEVVVKQLKRFSRTVFTLIFSFSLIFALTGCNNENDGALSGPNAPEEISSKNTTRSELNIIRTKNRGLNKFFESSALITVKDGGEITVGNGKHGESKIIFNHGDVSEDVLVTFSWESTGLLMGGATFSPHGINFNNPVEVRLSYKDADLNGIDPANLAIWYYNEDLDVWELVPSTVDTSRKRVIGYLNHFSRYALSAD